MPVGSTLECQDPGRRPCGGAESPQGILCLRSALSLASTFACQSFIPPPLIASLRRSSGCHMKDECSACAGADVGTTCSYQATFAGFEKAGFSRPDAEELFARSIQLTTAARDEFWSEYQEQVRILCTKKRSLQQWSMPSKPHVFRQPLLTARHGEQS